MKAQLFANIPESALDRIEVDNNLSNIIWKEEGKEFYFKGALYDLVKLEKVNGKTVLHCINDSKEHKLLNDFAKALNNQQDNGNGNKSAKHSIKFQLADFISIADLADSFLPSTEKASFITYTSSLATTLLEVNSPPPNWA